MVMRHVGPCTDEQLVENYMGLLTSPYWRKSLPVQSESGIRTRRRELADMQPPKVIDTGRKTRLHSGRYAIVWRALEGQEIAANEGRLRGIIDELEEQARRERTEGTLFDPDDGKPRRRE